MFWATLLLLMQFHAPMPCPAVDAPPPPMIPQNVWVNGVSWEITLVDHIGKSGADDQFIGWTIDEQYGIDTLPPDLRKHRHIHEILIDKHLRPLAMRDTVIHELSHAILSTKKSDDTMTTHRFIELNAAGWAKVLMENPTLVAWLGSR